MRELIPTDLGGLSAEGRAPNKVEKQEGQGSSRRGTASCLI